MQLLYGTYNSAKLASMRRMLSGLDITLIGLSELPSPPQDVEETGTSMLENARLKAVGYQAATGMTTLAADSGLYLEGVADALQPGYHPRRMQGHRMDDAEMTAFYAAIAADMGGRVKARYRNAVCIAFADGRVVDRFDDSVASTPFWIVDTPHPKRVEGFPIDSLSVEIQSNRYFYDIETRLLENDQSEEESGFCRFVREALAGQL